MTSKKPNAIIKQKKTQKINNMDLKSLKIGIPRALLYHRYPEFYKAFFEKLGCNVVLSPETNRDIFSKGIALSIDESCLPSKIYLGHIDWLLDKCDFIFIPRVSNFGFTDKLCAKFYAVYDIVASTFPKEKDKFLDLNIDYINGKKEKPAFLAVGKKLGFSKKETIQAYDKAKQVEHTANAERREKLLKQLKSDKLKILVVSHAYNTYDEYIGKPIMRALAKQGVEVLNILDIEGEDTKALFTKYTKSLYWAYNKELVGALVYLEEFIDGIVIITAFPCGPDAMVNEMLLRRQKKIPMINLVIDELAAEGGLETRIEAFVDMLSEFQKTR